jgi:hypothetical protein
MGQAEKIRYDRAASLDYGFLTVPPTRLSPPRDLWDQAQTA